MILLPLCERHALQLSKNYRVVLDEKGEPAWYEKRTSPRVSFPVEDEIKTYFLELFGAGLLEVKTTRAGNKYLSLGERGEFALSWGLF